MSFNTETPFSEETEMTYQSFKSALQNRIAYRRTVSELRALPLDIALDLHIHRDDAERIASTAVYG